MNKRGLLWGAMLWGWVFAAWGAPQLGRQPERIGEAFRARVLAGAQGIPAPTPQGQFFRVRSGASAAKTMRLFRPIDWWRERAWVGHWRDRKGNEMRLARVLSLLPEFSREYETFEVIARRLDEATREFEPANEALRARWLATWGEGVGRFFEVDGLGLYYVDFCFAEKVRPLDATRLLEMFVNSVSPVLGGAGRIQSMKWWEETNDCYRFMTDLDRAKGGRFIRETMRQITAMRKSYEFYVPAKQPLAVCRVRVFKSLAGYRQYRQSTGVTDTKSCGLWDPSREELLIVAENRQEAQATMRHEAFHQYLHFATGRGDHAIWFNEGHATFFEQVHYNAVMDTVKVTDEGSRAAWVAANPQRVASAMARVLTLSPAAFYSGDQNLNYVTAWAIVYFLQKGAYVADEFKPYREVIPRYLACMASGASAEEATREAWGGVKDRSLAEDFLRFWQKKRKQAVQVR